jgi:hypothetical protein
MDAIEQFLLEFLSLGIEAGYHPDLDTKQAKQIVGAMLSQRRKVLKADPSRFIQARE